mgnify:FL=1
METILLKFFLCMMGVIGLVVLANILFWLLRELSLTWREMKEKKKEGCQQQEKRIWLPEPPVLLTPKERREYLLNHVEDGRFYAISSLRGSDITIVCAKRYDAEEQKLYCYAYLWISGYSVYNLHVMDPRGIFKLRDFLGNKSLRIDFDCNPHLVIYEEDNISPYIVDGDYNAFVQSLQKAGFDWKIEKGEGNGLGSYKYLLKETITK